jgi:hypothetical protein
MCVERSDPDGEGVEIESETHGDMFFHVIDPKCAARSSNSLGSSDDFYCAMRTGVKGDSACSQMRLHGVRWRCCACLKLTQGEVYFGPARSQFYSSQTVK